MKDDCRRVKTSEDKWETSAYKERQIKGKLEKSSDEWRRMWEECRQIQTNNRWVLFYHSWIQSLLLFLLSKVQVNIKFEIKPCMEDFALCVLIYPFIIHNTNAQFTENDNGVKMMRNVSQLAHFKHLTHIQQILSIKKSLIQSRTWNL